MNLLHKALLSLAFTTALATTDADAQSRGKGGFLGLGIGPSRSRVDNNAACVNDSGDNLMGKSKKIHGGKMTKKKKFKPHNTKKALKRGGASCYAFGRKD